MPFLYSLCYPAADPYTIFVFADLFDILVFLVVTAAHTSRSQLAGSVSFNLFMFQKRLLKLALITDLAISYVTQVTPSNNHITLDPKSYLRSALD